MHSLGARLVWRLSIGIIAVLALAGVAIEALLARTLRTDFDEALIRRARDLTALFEQDQDGLESELLDTPLPEFAPGPAAEYFAVWRENGAQFVRSRSLGDSELPRFVGPGDAAECRSAQLPDGRAGRMVGLAFTPRQEYATNPADRTETLTFVLARGIDSLSATLGRVRAILFAGCAAAALVGIAVVRNAVRRSLRPVRAIGAQIEAVAAADLTTRISATAGPRELLPIVDRLNELLERLHASFERERRFTSDVAHELRTPLAGLRAKLELVLSRDRSPQAYQAALRDGLTIGVQMQRMVESLLHLARTDAGQIEMQRVSTPLMPLVAACWNALEDAARQRGLTVVAAGDSAAQASADPDLLRLVIHNLLENAVDYARRGSPIDVALRCEADRVALTISNATDVGLPDPLERVFDRFYRGENGDPTGHGHAGLGLALARAIVQRLQGRIAATRQGDQFRISVDLPRAADA